MKNSFYFIQNWKWQDISIALVIFCQIVVVSSALLPNLLMGTVELSLFEESFVSGMAHSIILLPIVLFSLKILKSYLALAVLALFFVLAQTLLMNYLTTTLAFDATVGNVAIYKQGETTAFGWFFLAVNPPFILCLVCLYLFFVNKSFK